MELLLLGRGGASLQILVQRDDDVHHARDVIVSVVAAVHVTSRHITSRHTAPPGNNAPTVSQQSKQKKKKQYKIRDTKTARATSAQITRGRPSKSANRVRWRPTVQNAIPALFFKSRKATQNVQNPMHRYSTTHYRDARDAICCTVVWYAIPQDYTPCAAPLPSTSDTRLASQQASKHTQHTTHTTQALITSTFPHSQTRAPPRTRA